MTHYFLLIIKIIIIITFVEHNIFQCDCLFRGKITCWQYSQSNKFNIAILVCSCGYLTGSSLPLFWNLIPQNKPICSSFCGRARCGDRWCTFSCWGIGSTFDSINVYDFSALNWGFRVNIDNFPLAANWLSLGWRRRVSRTMEDADFSGWLQTWFQRQAKSINGQFDTIIWS